AGPGRRPPTRPASRRCAFASSTAGGRASRRRARRPARQRRTPSGRSTRLPGARPPLLAEHLLPARRLRHVEVAELELVELAVFGGLREQLVVRAALDDLAAHQD